MKYFNQANNCITIRYDVIQTLKTSPFSIIMKNPEFKSILNEMEEKYENEHKQIAQLLEDYGYLKS